MASRTTWQAAPNMHSTKTTAEEVTAFEQNGIKDLANIIGDSTFAVGEKVTITDLDLIGHVVLALENGSIEKANFPMLAGYYEHVKSALPYLNEVHGPAIDCSKQIWARLK
ncbi:hypothetical protein V5799_007558 [Amblyomma americanum]|uniref:GST C-terminal domain-containing protein n=1 Tax=Amblyomma americanum TaxID=6943 RepID=A0AAQ4FHL3_AMBAM